MKTLTALSFTLLLGTTAAFAGSPSPKAPAVLPTTSVATNDWEVAAGAYFGELNLDWGFGSTLGFDSNPLNSSEKDSYISPALDFRRVIARKDGMTLRLGLGYSYAEGSWQAGEHIAGEDGEGTDELYTIDIASMDLTAHRIAAYVDASWELGSGFEFGVRVGPTLTLFDGKFAGSHETFQHINPGEFGVFTTGGSLTSEGTKAAIGASGEAFLRYNLPSAGMFVEVSGGYNWTDKVQFGSSKIGASVDAASWRAGVSVGFKF